VYIHVILLFMTVLLHDNLRAGASVGASAGISAGVSAGPHPWLTLAIAVVPQVLLVLISLAVTARGTRRFEHTRRGEHLLAADITPRLLWLSAGVHCWAIFFGHWAELVRFNVGNIIAIDELLICAPALACTIGLISSRYSVERRIHELLLLSSIDRGEPIAPLPPRARWVNLQVRHQLLVVLIPLALTTGWGEAVTRSLNLFFDQAIRRGDTWWLYPVADWLAAGDGSRAHAAELILQISGIFGVLSLVPLGLPLLWDVRPIRTGELAEVLTEMCRREAVRFRDILLWRTDGSMLNGAVVGVVPFARFVLLTDALVERLPREQLLAVMAHELAHAKLRHILWLAGSLIVGSTIGAVATYAAGWAVHHYTGVGSTQGHVLLASIGSVLAGISVMGAVSRRFEWQADAFAVKHLSGRGTWEVVERVVPDEPATADASGPTPLELEAAYGLTMSPQPPLEQEPPSPTFVRRTITADGSRIVSPAVDAMAGALLSVARLNHIPVRKWTFRHGSIAERIARIRRLEGLPPSRLPIDRVVLWCKLAIATGMLIVIGLTVRELLIG